MTDHTDNSSDKPDILLESISFRSVLDNLSDAVLMLDTNMRVIYWNHGARMLFGLDNSDTRGRFCGELNLLCHVDRHGKKQCGTSSCLFKKILDTGFSGQFPQIVYMHNLKGEKIPVKLSTDVFRDEHSLIRGMVAVITSLKDQYHQVQLAGEIQRRFVTTKPVSSSGFKIETLYEAMEETSGDYVEAVVLNDGRLFFTLADATGHGISASLFTMVYKSLLHANIGSSIDLSLIVKKINTEYMAIVNVDGYYMTAAVVIFDPKTGCGQYVSAGNPPMMVFDKTEEGYLPCALLEATSPMLGLDPEMEFGMEEFELKQGQILLAATDGLYETPTLDTSPFGMEGASLFFRDHDTENALKLLHEYLQGISQYTEPVDDITMLLLYKDK